MQPPQNDDDEFISRKVIVEHSASSGTSGSTIGVIIAIVVIALILVGYILMHLHR
jgi:hypothetical protein